MTRPMGIPRRPGPGRPLLLYFSASCQLHSAYPNPCRKICPANAHLHSAGPAVLPPPSHPSRAREALTPTVILPSSSLSLARSFFQDTEGSGWPRGGTHSRTAGSPTATTRFPGVCLKSSRRTVGRKKRHGDIMGDETGRGWFSWP